MDDMVLNIIIFFIGVFVGALGKEIADWVIKMSGNFLKQQRIIYGVSDGDFPENILKYHPADKEEDDSDWNIRILHPKKSIPNCEIRFNPSSSDSNQYPYR